jgi:hypothetical protein
MELLGLIITGVVQVVKMKNKKEHAKTSESLPIEVFSRLFTQTNTLLLDSLLVKWEDSFQEMISVFFFILNSKLVGTQLLILAGMGETRGGRKSKPRNGWLKYP